MFSYNIDFNLRKSFGPSCRYQDSKDSFPKNLSKSAMSVTSRSSAKDSEDLSPRLPYQGFHAYPWNLQRHAPSAGAGAGSGYPYNYYNTNPYYRNWFHNYKEQWHQHWQRFRGAAQYNGKFSSLLGKLPRSKLCVSFFSFNHDSQIQSMCLRCFSRFVIKYKHTIEVTHIY